MMHWINRLDRAARLRLLGIMTIGLLVYAGVHGYYLGQDKYRDLARWSLTVRKYMQYATTYKFEVFYRFRFNDVAEERGLTAVERLVRTNAPSPYVHGTGICADDVDNDGWIDVYFTSQYGGNELWRNTGDGRFENITDDVTALKETTSMSCSFGDIDNDGLSDLYVSAVRTGNKLLKNMGGGKFKDITRSAGVGLSAHSSAAAFVDYDADGLLDLFVTNMGSFTLKQRDANGSHVPRPRTQRELANPLRAERSVLYRNLGNGSFRDVSNVVRLGAEGWNYDATFTDLRGDGYPDILVVNMSSLTRLYDNERGVRFIDNTLNTFGHTSHGTMGAKFFDIENDSDLDLFLIDNHSDMWYEQTYAQEKLKTDLMLVGPEVYKHAVKWNGVVLGNSLYRNDQGTFVEVSDEMNVESYRPWGASVGDFNADGFQDVFLTAGMGYPYRYEINSLLLNNKGREFLDSEFIVGIEPRKKLTYDERSGVKMSMSSRSSVTFDVDGDGDLDIIANQADERPQFFISNLSRVKPIRYIQVKLEGVRSNRDGLGARVRVFVGENVYMQYNDGKSGYLAQSDLPLYFGLNRAESVNSIEVLWPSGDKTIVSGPIQVNQTLTITERDDD